MIDSTLLLDDCRRLVRGLEVDLRERVEADEELRGGLIAEHQAARDAGRTAQSFSVWRDGRLTQGAVAWVLGCVFVRFLEDTGLLGDPWLAGSGQRLEAARGRQTLFFREHPELSHREYLQAAFRTVAASPAAADLFDEAHNPLWGLPVSGDAARELVEFFRRIDPDTGELAHDFRDERWDTRFLGDLYQDLSESARKQYALLQTPVFIEEFILERTLEPAIDEFGLAEVRLIDPACGSGHFLLGAFDRLLAHWRELEPGADPRVHVARALAAIAGVDLNPFAAAIARFRVMVAVLRACGVTHLRDSPDFKIEIAVGDSLLHTPRPDRLDVGSAAIRKGFEQVYVTEDAPELRRILGRHYHAVVANPPYITPKDKALNEAYRDRYDACSGKYALSVPFMELLFALAVPNEGPNKPAGFVGQITSNSFMRREFGKRLIETFLPRVDLTLVIDTAGAYIPGHGTPTVILVGRNRPGLAPTIRTAMGIRGEPTAPSDPAFGLVWRAIVDQIDQPGTQSPYISVEDTPRARFARHPWTMSGGGAGELRAALERGGRVRLATIASAIGVMAVLGEDDAFAGIRGRGPTIELIEGDVIRDWLISPGRPIINPYDREWTSVNSPSVDRSLWPYATLLKSGIYFGKTREERGLRWTEFAVLVKDKLGSSLLIAFSFVSTHGHFALSREIRVTKQSAPVIRLESSAGEDDYLGLLGLLNSSTACFWLKQVCHDKGGGGIGGGLATEGWEHFFEFTATKVSEFPVSSFRPVDRARRLDSLATSLAAKLPTAVEPTKNTLEVAKRKVDEVSTKMAALQEELDWEVYRLYGLIEEDLTLPENELPRLRLGERAFEVVLARRVASGEEETAWFERQNATPITELPADWPKSYRRLVERRIEVIASNQAIGLIERPEYKRRWQREPWEMQERHALRAWLLDRLESKRFWPGEPTLISVAQLADRARQDPEFVQVAELYDASADLTELVVDLVTKESVPYLAALRCTDAGLEKRAEWEQVWELQRREDAIDALCDLRDDDPRRLTPEQAKARKRAEVGDIAVPPRYVRTDFRKTEYWSLRGKLDVAKERFISYPLAERGADSTPVIGWAGWNHLEKARALAAYLTRLRTEEAWDAERLTPLLAGLRELLPWLYQWHNEYDANLGASTADAYANFLSSQLAELGLATDDLEHWRSPEQPRGARRRRVTA